jgi:hypothetical protein
MTNQKMSTETIKWDSPTDELVGVAKLAFAQLDKGGLAHSQIRLIVPHANWGLQLQRACEAQGVSATFNMPMERLSAGATVELAKLEFLANPASAHAREILLKVPYALSADSQNAEGSKGSVGVNSRLSAVPEAKPSGAAEAEAGIWDAEGVTGEDALAAFAMRNESVKGFSLLNVAHLKNFHEFDHALLHINGDEGATQMFDIVSAQLACPTIPEHTSAVSIEHMLYAHNPADLVILVACVDGFVPGAAAYAAATDQARAQAVSTWREAFNKCAGLGTQKTYISLFTRAEEALAKQAHFQIARTKMQNGQRVAQLRPTPFLDEWGLDAPSTCGGQALLRHLGLN